MDVAGQHTKPFCIRVRFRLRGIDRPSRGSAGRLARVPGHDQIAAHQAAMNPQRPAGACSACIPQHLKALSAEVMADNSIIFAIPT